MIVDCHTHIWSDARELGQGAETHLARQAGRQNISASPAEHEKAAECVDKTLILGYRSARLEAQVPNDLIAEYVANRGDRMIGIAAVDPTDGDAVRDADELLDRGEFRGLTVSPADQGFHPADSRAMAIYALASQRHAPVFFQQGTNFAPRAPMEYARPMLLDEIAREFPALTLVVSAMGHPWVEECIALLGKHPRVFCDTAGLVRRPWQAYNALVLAYQSNVMDKILFGSDFPYSTAAEAIEAIYRLHEVTQGTNLPGVPREALRSMIERDALRVLGIALPGEQPAKAAEDEEEL